MNPVLETDVFIPDVEARKMPNGRLYIYGSLDNSGDTEFCSTKYITYSTSDMIHWQNHGTIFDSEDPLYELNNNLTLGGPDCLYINGKYYLYYCTYGNGMGVAVADSPAGPFKNIGPIIPADGESIDPAIFQDDDGSIYYYWGQFNLSGGKLSADMQTVLPETINSCIVSEHEHGFHEGASIRKLNGMYYLVYTDISRGKATCLAYATSEHPLGPYKKQGIIIDNAGCDSASWNNHGSIEVYQDQLYVFYHRSSQNSMYNRRLCVEPLQLNKDGSINEVFMTSNGVSATLPGNTEISVSNLSKMKVKLPFDHLQPMSLMPCGEVEALCYTKADDWAKFDNIDFGIKKTRFKVKVGTIKPMKVEVWIEGNKQIGVCEISATQNWYNIQEFTCEIDLTSGIHTVWLVFKNSKKSVGRLGDVYSFSFE